MKKKYYTNPGAMPRSSGYECFEEKNYIKRLRTFPIIICSTSNDEYIADRLYQKVEFYHICQPGDYTQLKKIPAYALQIVSK